MFHRPWVPLDPQLSLTGAVADLQSNRITSLDLVERCLAMIDRFEPSLRAWVVVDRENARRLAIASDCRRASGQSFGLLDGVPIGIKDIIDVAGLPTTAGAARWAHGPALQDADFVAALRSAGAIPLGKTVTTPYAWIDPPPTRNPWNLDRTPGGSSSGSAAAVAAGMCPAALGSQTGGSIIRPAAYCGLAGLKPGYGRLSMKGILPLAPSLDHPGIITRTISDLQLLWSIFEAEGGTPSVTLPPRIGRLGDFFDARSQPVALAALTDHLNSLRAAGAAISEPVLPHSLEQILVQHRLILAFEAWKVHEARYNHMFDDYPIQITRLIDEGERVPLSDYSAAHADLINLRDSAQLLFEAVDVFVTLAAPGPAPDRTTTGDPVLNSPWSYLGLPTVTIPISMTEDGLPLAAQFVGPPRSERKLLAIAFWCERARVAGQS